MDIKRIGIIILTGAAVGSIYWLQPWIAQPVYGLLAEACVSSLILLWAFSLNWKWLAYGGLCGAGLSLLAAVPLYVLYIKNYDLIKLTILLGGLSLIFVFLYLGLKLFRKSEEQNGIYMIIIQSVGAAAITLLFFLFRMLIVLGIHYYQVIMHAKSAFTSIIESLFQEQAAADAAAIKVAERLQNSVLAAYYLISGLLFMLSGYVYGRVYIRYAGIGLILLCLSKLYELYLL